MAENYTNVHFQDEDLAKLDSISEKMFGTDEVAYRLTVNRLIEEWEAES